MYKPYVFDFKKMVVYDIVLPTLIPLLTTINHFLTTINHC